MPLVPWGKLCRPLSKKFLEILAKKLAVCFSELHSSCAEDSFEEKQIWNWWFSCTFCALRKPLWSFGGTFLLRLTNILLYGFRNRNLRVQGKKLRIFFEKIYGFSIFSVLWPNCFWFLGRNLRQVVSKLH